jgi:hypothetical protein
MACTSRTTVRRHHELHIRQVETVLDLERETARWPTRSGVQRAAARQFRLLRAMYEENLAIEETGG